MVKNVVVLGASGMLGHKMLQILSEDFNTSGTLRKHNSSPILEPYCLYENIEAGNFSTLTGILKNVDVIVNCIGIVKQLPESNDWNISHAINTEFPHKLSTYASTHGIQLIHISTDCVFDGQKGMYTENDIPNAIDIYGRTKFAGEVRDALTLRTSIIGREINTRHGLLEWFLSKQGMKVQGYKESVFSGVTTNELSYLVSELIYWMDDLTGVYHVASTPINKFDLLTNINQYIDNKIEIEPVAGEIINRSLDGTKLRRVIGYTPPSWDEMIDEMMVDNTEYGDK